jgi:hypothetical protein
MSDAPGGGRSTAGLGDHLDAALHLRAARADHRQAGSIAPVVYEMSSRMAEPARPPTGGPRTGAPPAPGG